MASDAQKAADAPLEPSDQAAVDAAVHAALEAQAADHEAAIDAAVAKALKAQSEGVAPDPLTDTGQGVDPAVAKAIAAGVHPAAAEAIQRGDNVHSLPDARSAIELERDQLDADADVDPADGSEVAD